MKFFKSKEEKNLEKIIENRENWALFGTKFLEKDEDFKENAMKLMEIYNTYENGALVNYLRDPNNKGDYDGLFKMLSASFLSSIIVVLDESFIHQTVNGVSMVYRPTPHTERELLYSSKDPKEISEETQTHTLMVHNINGKHYTMIFTNKKSLEKTLNQNDATNLYPQLSNFAEIVFYVIASENIDGILLADKNMGIPLNKQILINNFEKIKSLSKEHDLISLKSSLFIFDK